MLAAVLLLAPLPLIPLASRSIVDRLAPRLAAEIAAIFDHLSFVHALEGEAPASSASPEDFALDPAAPFVPGLDVLRPMDGAARARGDAPARGLSAPRGGILVRADLVAAAVQSGSRPSGFPVPASGLRPAGLALSGVGGYGAGLRDGDVLTRVGGAPATSVGVVVGAVAGALQQRSPVITGEVWRGDQRLVVVVEIPTTKQLEPRRRHKKKRVQKL